VTAAESNDRIRIDLDRFGVEVADVTRAVNRLIVLEEELSRCFDQMLMRQELIDQRVADQQARIAENGTRITELNSRMAEYSARMAEIDERVAQSAVQIAESNARIADQAARTAEHSARLVQIAESTAAIVEQDKRLDAMLIELGRQREELHQLRVEVTRWGTTLRNTAWAIGIGVPVAIGVITPLAELV
jgi:chromosome segregation ATPase